MAMETPACSWYKIASMDKTIIKNASILCLSNGIKYHFSDDYVNPPAVWFFTTYGVYRSICRALGFS